MCIFKHDERKMKKKMLKLPVLVGPLATIQPYINFPWSLGYLRKLAFGSSRGNYFTHDFVWKQHTAPRNITVDQTLLPSQGTNSQLGQVELRGFISSAQRNSRQASVGFKSRTSRSAVERTTTGPTRPDNVNITYIQKLSSLNYIKGMCEY